MFVAPMLPAKRCSAFRDERYLYEPKLDGDRLVLEVKDGQVRLYSEHGFDLTAQYPELQAINCRKLEDSLLDGVIVAFDQTSETIDSDELRRRYRMTNRMDIRVASVKCPVHFLTFDIIRFHGEDLRQQPLLKRKELLSELVEDSRVISVMPYLEHDAVGLFEALGRSTLGGIVAKDKSSVYHSGRASAWKLITNYRYLKVRIAGYRKNQFGWLVELGESWRTIIGDSVPRAYREAFNGVAKLLVTGEDRDFIYVRPELEAELRYRKQRADGSPVEPEFVRFVV